MKQARMPIVIAMAFFLSASFLGTGFAEIKKAAVPNVNLTPTLKSVMSKKDDSLRNEKKKEPELNTNGYILNDGNIVVDSIIDPKCVFYGNYNEGSGDVFQSVDIDTIIFECE